MFRWIVGGIQFCQLIWCENHNTVASLPLGCVAKLMSLSWWHLPFKYEVGSMCGKLREPKERPWLTLRNMLRHDPPCVRVKAVIYHSTKWVDPLPGCIPYLSGPHLGDGAPCHTRRAPGAKFTDRGDLRTTVRSLFGLEIVGVCSRCNHPMIRDLVGNLVSNLVGNLVGDVWLMDASNILEFQQLKACTRKK
jgi:hypothetical protein